MQVACDAGPRGFDDGGKFSVPVGYEVDITLDSAPDSYGWQVGMQVVLSSDAATVIDVLIPAGPVNPAGPTYLYRIKALSPGQVVVQNPAHLGHLGRRAAGVRNHAEYQLIAGRTTVLLRREDAALQLALDVELRQLVEAAHRRAGDDHDRELLRLAAVTTQERSASSLADVEDREHDVAPAQQLFDLGLGAVVLAVEVDEHGRLLAPPAAAGAGTPVRPPPASSAP